MSDKFKDYMAEAVSTGSGKVQQATLSFGGGGYLYITTKDGRSFYLDVDATMLRDLVKGKKLNNVVFGEG